MPESSKKRKKSVGATASGIVRAVTQDVELTIEQMTDAAHEAVVAVESKLHLGKARTTTPLIRERTATTPKTAAPKKVVAKTKSATTNRLQKK